MVLLKEPRRCNSTPTLGSCERQTLKRWGEKKIFERNQVKSALSHFFSHHAELAVLEAFWNLLLPHSELTANKPSAQIRRRRKRVSVLMSSFLKNWLVPKFSRL